MTHHSRLVINNDPTNTSHLSEFDKLRINELQAQIDDLKNKKTARKLLGAFELFENKHFNSFKAKFPHQSGAELRELIVSKWEN